MAPLFHRPKHFGRLASDRAPQIVSWWTKVSFSWLKHGFHMVFTVFCPVFSMVFPLGKTPGAQDAIFFDSSRRSKAGRSSLSAKRTWNVHNHVEYELGIYIYIHDIIWYINYLMEYYYMWLWLFVGICIYIYMYIYIYLYGYTWIHPIWFDRYCCICH